MTDIVAPEKLYAVLCVIITVIVRVEGVKDTPPRYKIMTVLSSRYKNESWGLILVVIVVH